MVSYYLKYICRKPKFIALFVWLYITVQKNKIKYRDMYDTLVKKTKKDIYDNMP